jgi:cell division protein FtsN
MSVPMSGLRRPHLPRGPRRGGFAVGLIVGLLIGLVLALGVALYVTKVPVPFINKVPQRTAEQDNAEAERNKNWDPNAPLSGKATARSASGPATAAPKPVTAAPAAAPAPAPAPVAAASSPRQAAPASAAASAARPAAKPAADPMIYFAQAGAYTRGEDAEAQRAKLALLGLDAKVTEREQSGRTIYRVRVGPFDARDAADAAMDRLQAAGVESSLVRVERQ